MRAKLLLAAIIGFGIGTTAQPELSGPIAGLPMFLGVAPVKAQTPARNTARRTSRRTSRRVARRTSVAGCTPYNAYYNCGGVYYAPTVENGTTVYIVVNP